MTFPMVRKRRLRRTETIRRMVRGTRLSVDNLVAPLFLVSGTNIKKEISSMPDQFHFSVDMVTKECQELSKLGVPAVILFVCPDSKQIARKYAA